jgi:flagellar FliL protein
MKKKLIIALPLLLIVGFLGYKMFGPKPPVPKMKVEGVLAKMDPEFMINLSDGRFAKMTVALQLDEKDPLAEEMAAGGGHGGGAETPAHPQNDVLRAIVTDEFTGQPASSLLDSTQRSLRLKELKKRINQQTDAKVNEVLLTDITVD